jgi:hypothetical protein
VAYVTSVGPDIAAVAMQVFAFRPNCSGNSTERRDGYRQQQTTEY